MSNGKVAGFFMLFEISHFSQLVLPFLADTMGEASQFNFLPKGDRDYFPSPISKVNRKEYKENNENVMVVYLFYLKKTYKTLLCRFFSKH